VRAQVDRDLTTVDYFDRLLGLIRNLGRHTPTGTGLTGAAHQSDRCSSVVFELLVPLRPQVGLGGCWFLGLAAL
jgi:hypothetical protein